MLVAALDRLRWLKEDQRPTEEQQRIQNLVDQPVIPIPMSGTPLQELGPQAQKSTTEVSEDSRGDTALDTISR